MRLTSSPWCVELSPQECWWLNMLIEKQWGMLMTTLELPKELVRRCNDCIYWAFCLDQKEANLKFLEQNEK
jgi:hypothetical protein